MLVYIYMPAIDRSLALSLELSLVGGVGRRALTVDLIPVVGGDGDGAEVVGERHGHVGAVCVAELVVPDEPRNGAVLQEVRFSCKTRFSRFLNVKCLFFEREKSLPAGSACTRIDYRNCSSCRRQKSLRQCCGRR